MRKHGMYAVYSSLLETFAEGHVLAGGRGCGSARQVHMTQFRMYATRVFTDTGHTCMCA
jgi:hypothetical protein